MKKRILRLTGLLVLGIITILLCRALDRENLRTGFFGEPDGPAVEAFSALTEELGDGGIGRAVCIFAEELTRHAAP